MRIPRRHGEARPHDPGMPMPRYHQIYLVLRERIAEGRYPADRPIPGELELAAQFGVSRVTLRSAMDRLTEEGLVVRQRGRGTFVCGPSGQSSARADVRGVLENLVSMGLKTSVRIVELSSVAAPADVAGALRLPPGAPVQKAVRVRSYKGAPLAHLTTFVPDDIGRRFGRRELAAKPMLVLLEEAGVKAERARQTVSARLADANIAELLGTEVGAALLSVERIVHDTHGRPVQLLRGLYRPDRYEYQMQLSRVGDEARIWVSDEGVGDEAADAPAPGPQESGARTAARGSSAS